jgi:hypothetical protein
MNVLKVVSAVAVLTACASQSGETRTQARGSGGGNPTKADAPVACRSDAECAPNQICYEQICRNNP